MKTVDFREQIIQAMITLWAHKFRSFLTVLGVVIGTATVIAVGSLVTGMQKSVREQIEQFGTNSAFVTKIQGGPHRSELTEEERKRRPLTVDDAIALGQLPSVVATSPILRPSGLPPVVKFHSNEVRTPEVRGVWAAFARTRDITIAQGRFFTETEDEHAVEACVIGSNIADKLLSGYEPLEKEIIVGSKVFRVIGILEKSKSSPMGGGMNVDNVIYIPYHVMHTMYPAQREHFITLSAKQGQLDKMIDDATELLRRRRNVAWDQPNNFSINTPSGIIDTFNGMLSVVALIVVPIVGVALLVGGIGVMNIMLVSVTERTKEIGVRKAIGAKRRDIIFQFLTEAVTLTGLGGVLGILFGWGLAEIVKLVMPTFIPLWAPITGFVVSVVLGVGFGLWPAWKAARLDPIEALRYE